MPKINFENDLNKEQLAAATAKEKSLLVLAAAGTGKTRTLVYRVAYLVEEGISPDRILLLTFTNKAAREMMDRAQLLAGDGVGGIWGGTFHHMANRILRRHASLIGYRSQFTILDRDDSKTLISNCVKELGLKRKEFPKAAVLMSLFGSAANTEASIDEILECRIDDFEENFEGIRKVYEMYEEKKRTLDAMDFDDLLVNCIKLFREHKDVLARYHDQFMHVLVDEYQDTNTIQAQLVDMLSGKDGNLFVVGDDFQTIYSWRGADFRNIMSFPERYPDTKIYKLETNYRSVPEVLEVANACIAGNPEQFQKTLKPTRESYKKPVVARMRSGDEQARYIVNYIRKLKRSGYKLPDIAILYRAHFHAMEVEWGLTKENIPYEITSGVRFFEQAHIKDVCSVLRILVNPEDELSFARFFGLLPGVGPKTAQKMWKKLGNKFEARKPEVRDLIQDFLPLQACEIWKELEQVFAVYDDEKLFEDGGEVLYRFVTAFYEKHASNVFDNSQQRVDDINELILNIPKFESVEQFLSDVALLTNLDAEAKSFNNVEKDALHLSTVHQAKGLEWPVVIIIWATEGMFPSNRSLQESEEGDSEERRLFYVAVTRAKDELIMCVPELRRMRDGGVLYCTTSRFIEEIPLKLVDDQDVGFI